MTISETTESPQTSLRTYEVRTFGCQMNVHDSERMAGLLEASGYVRAAEGEEPDLVVFTLARCARTHRTVSTGIWGSWPL